MALSNRNRLLHKALHTQLTDHNRRRIRRPPGGVLEIDPQEGCRDVNADEMAYIRAMLISSALFMGRFRDVYTLYVNQ